MKKSTGRIAATAIAAVAALAVSVPAQAKIDHRLQAKEAVGRAAAQARVHAEAASQYQVQVARLQAKKARQLAFQQSYRVQVDAQRLRRDALLEAKVIYERARLQELKRRRKMDRRFR